MELTEVLKGKLHSNSHVCAVALKNNLFSTYVRVLKCNLTAGVVARIIFFYLFHL